MHLNEDIPMMDNVDYIIMCCHWQKNGFPYFGLFWLMCLFRICLWMNNIVMRSSGATKHENCRHINLIITICANFRKCIWPQLTVRYTCPVPSLRLLSLEYYEENRENLIINRNQSTNISALSCKIQLTCKWKCVEWHILITHDNCTCIFHDLSK